VFSSALDRRADVAHKSIRPRSHKVTPSTKYDPELEDFIREKRILLSAICFLSVIATGYMLIGTGWGIVLSPFWGGALICHIIIHHYYIILSKDPGFLPAVVSNILLFLSFSFHPGATDFHQYFAFDMLLNRLGWRSSLYEPAFMSSKIFDPFMVYIVYLAPLFTWIWMIRKLRAGSDEKCEVDKSDKKINLAGAGDYRGYQIIEHSDGTYGVYSETMRVPGSRSYSSAHLARSFVDHYG
jgi:hypothetical protein